MVAAFSSSSSDFFVPLGEARSTILSRYGFAINPH